VSVQLFPSHNVFQTKNQWEWCRDREEEDTLMGEWCSERKELKLIGGKWWRDAEKVKMEKRIAEGK
jgi:hypothetical protein